MFFSPVSIVALLVAMGAPWLVRAMADRMELGVKRNTEALLVRARARAGLGDPATSRTRKEQGARDDG